MDDLIKLICSYRQIMSYSEKRDRNSKLLSYETNTYSNYSYDDLNHLVVLKSKDQESTYVLSDSLLCDTRQITEIKDQIIIRNGDYNKKLYGIK